jgi:hypothetical protein
MDEPGRRHGGMAAYGHAGICSYDSYRAPPFIPDFWLKQTLVRH